jgi:hypothetical protein
MVALTWNFIDLLMVVFQNDRVKLWKEENNNYKRKKMKGNVYVSNMKIYDSTMRLFYKKYNLRRGYLWTKYVDCIYYSLNEFIEIFIVLKLFLSTYL